MIVLGYVALKDRSSSATLGEVKVVLPHKTEVRVQL